MANKKKRLVEQFDQIIENGDFEAFKGVFDKCEIDAKVPGGKTTLNAFSFKNLTPKHIQFLVDNGLEVNADCGFGYPAVYFHASNKENLKCLIENGADVDYVASAFRGNALTGACETLNSQAVENLLEAGASIDAKDVFGRPLLELTLESCDNIYIPQAVRILKMLLEAGCEKTEKATDLVRKIGERFEFYRDSISEELVNSLSVALDELYRLFDVTPVPGKKIYDGKSPISVNSTKWQEQYNELWQMLVPGNGKAKTVQGEMIRIVGRVTHEILDNGSMNWGPDFKLMLKTYSDFLSMNESMEQELLEEATGLSKSISANSDKAVLYRLTELTVKWVLSYPNPLPLGKVEYIH